MLQLNKENYIVNLLVNANSNENIKHGLRRFSLPLFFLMLFSIYTFDGKKYRTKATRIKSKTTIPADTSIEGLLKSPSSPHLQETHFPTILEALFKDNKKIKSLD